MIHLKKIISDTPKRDAFFVCSDFNTFRERIVNYLQDLHEQVHECMNVINSINVEQISGKDGQNGKDGIGISNVILNSDNSFTFFMTDGTVIVTDPVNIEGGGGSGADGEDGVGILSIQVIKSSTESSGLNTIRVNLTNNTHYDFDIYNGEKGDKGQDGKDGKDGQNGTDGKSAYQLAVEQGYSGTLQEWLLSLKGEPGQNGQDGADGQDGTDGTDGADGQNGITPHIDSTTGNWFIGNQDTGVKAQGSNGQNGTNGITPHIDSVTGNWFIGDTNTNIPAQGPAGSDASVTSANIITALGYTPVKCELVNSLPASPESGTLYLIAES